MLLLVVLFAVGTAALEPYVKPYYDLEDAHNLFKDFVQEHGKVYSQDEYATRLEIFKQNLADINERNTMHPQSVFKVNSFADWTSEEIRGLYGMRLRSEDVDKIAQELHYPPEAITAPDQFDWRDKGVVTHVKNQGHCCSCWVFSATGCIEGQYAIKHNKTLAFSEQQSLDCINNDVTKNKATCDLGGWPAWVMALADRDGMSIVWGLSNCLDIIDTHILRIRENGGNAYKSYHEKFGVVLEKDIPYTASIQKCVEPSSKVVTKVTSYKSLKPDEETLKQLLYETGPLSVALDPADLIFHHKGIIFPKYCHDFVCHALLLVGYGVENGTKYWILKDSFGLAHGDHGYFKLVRGVNACHMGTSYTATCTVA